MKKSEFARRVGVGKSAVANAIARGLLDLDAEGGIALDGEKTKFYLSRLSKHRGKSRAAAEPAPAGPERTAAAFARARASYARDFARFQRRKAGLVPASMADAYEAALLAGVAAALAEEPRPDPSEPELERALEGFISVALRRGVKEAPARARVILGESPESGAELPAEIPEASSLADAKASLDHLAAARLNLAAAIEAGELIEKDESRRRMGGLDGRCLGPLRSWPRRSVARLQAAREAEGLEAACALLEKLLTEEAERLRV